MTNLRIWLAILVVGLLFAANIWRAQELNLAGTPTSWVVAAMPAALSQIGYGHPHDYTELTAVRAAFEHGVTTPGWLNAAISEALSLEPATMDRSWALLGPDDKGLVDFVWLAFAIFGLRFEAFVWLFFLILGLSVLLLIARFWREPWALLIVAAFLAAHLAHLSLIPINLQLRGLIAPRVLSILSLLAFLHLALEVTLTWSRGFRWASVPAGLAQIGVIVFTMHLTSRTAYQVLGLTMLVLLVVAGALPASRRVLIRRGLLSASSPGRLASLAALWPLVALWAGQIGLDVYKHQVYNPRYFQGEVSAASHVFWHSLFVGLSANPRLAEEFDIRVSDVAVIAATGRYLEAVNRHDDWVAMGGESPRFTGIRRGLYDQAVRDFLIDTCQREPGACLAAVGWYKPRYAVEYLLWFLRWRSETPAPHMLSPILAEQFSAMAGKMDERGAGLDLGRVDLALAVVVLGALLAPFLMCAWRLLLPVLVFGLATALLPSIIAYPIAHTLSDLLVMFGVAVYTLLGLVSAVGSRMVYQRLRTKIRVGVTSSATA